MNKELFEKYASLKQQEKEVAEALKAMAPQVISEMQANDAEKVPSSLGTFSLGKYTSYKYSKKVQDAEKSVKMLKEDEKRTGVAEIVETPSLKFYFPKEKDDE